MESGAYVSIRELVKLRYQGRGFSFLPRQPLHSQLAGLHASRLRGRGLDFDELRAYQPGDDVRDIDWKVTARTRKPHTRIYTEERDRSALLLVDQRVNMFFGSRVSMKSVTAAQAAALGVWRVLAQGDRPGAIVFNDTEFAEIPPHRSQARAMAILHEIERMNRALRADSGQRSEPRQLNQVLERAARLASHDHLVVLVSDLDGMDEETPRLLNRLTRHNDVMVVLVYDPLERELPEASLLVVSDGVLQLEIDARDRALRSGFTRVFQDTVDTGRKELHKRSVPMLPISTAEPVAVQVRELLGKRR
jgi:uncharacterized protein (DUF58 family)